MSACEAASATDTKDIYRMLAEYAGHVPKDAKLADLPVQMPTAFERAISMNPAMAPAPQREQETMITADDM